MKSSASYQQNRKILEEEIIVFSGIVQGLVPTLSVKKIKNMMQISVGVSDLNLVRNLPLGGSVAINGVCLTVTHIEKKHDITEVFFDVIQETIEKTSLGSLSVDNSVNFERSLKMGDEIGGHMVSGHVTTTGTVEQIESIDHKTKVTIKLSPVWSKYLMDKDYIAIDGISLTLVDVKMSGFFDLHLIPETLKRTTLGSKKTGELVNIEFHPQTQTIVDFLERKNI